MNSAFFKKLLPHIIAVFVFLFVSVIYCSPALQGKVVEQHDNQGWKGMAQQSFEFKEKYGRMPYWTNSMFSGMPAYLIAYETPNRISIGYIHTILTLGLPKPINYFFLACIMAYFLLVVLKINPWIGVMGGLCYAYSTFDAIIISVGHDTQMICIAYAPAVIGSLILLFQKRYVAGTILMTLFTSMIIFQNHIQVTYYTMLTALALSFAYFIHAFRNKEVSHAVKATGLAAVSGIIAMGVCAINLFPMKEFTGETMRGGRSELTDTSNAKNKTAGGLDKDYAFSYSVGKAETFTFMVPRIYGGSNRTYINGEYRTEFSASGDLAKTFSEKAGAPEDQALDYINQIGLSPYWGEQQPTAGPVYLGAIICFLFIFGLVYLESWHKWWLIAATIFGVLLAWGKNLEFFNYFLFEHLPFFNKFRAPSMALVIPQLTVPVLAALTLQQFVTDTNKIELWKKLKTALYITAGLFAILVVLYFTFDYAAPGEKDLKQGLSGMMVQQLAKGQAATPQVQQQADDFGRSIVSALHKDRSSLFGGDLLRSFLFIALAAGLLYLYVKNKIKAVYVLAGIIILSCADVLSVASRYLNHKNFTDEAAVDATFNTNPAIEKIKADPNHNNVRVYDQADFAGSTISYYFNSIGGYSPAKLGLYQDIISHQLSKGNMNVFNMLNAKYFIVQNPANGQPDAQINPDALGNCWFVKGFSLAKNADDEMKQLTTLNTKDSAVIDIRYQQIAGAEPVFDSAASIKMLENLNDKITYKSSASKPQFAVFSEVYYPYGWDAYIDGKKTDYCRVNYVLRGMPVPAGEHAIEFRFEPKTVAISDKFSMWSSILLYLMLIGGLVYALRKKKNSSIA
ncbi:MAG: hypothetical protein ABIU63_05390 [Chitinophagaceae bacterium]